MLTTKDLYRTDVKLIDFGLAAIFAPGADKNLSSDMFAGTPSYMPPEVRPRGCR